LGGVHRGREFKFVMTPEEGTVFQALPSTGTPKERWHEFFKRYPLALWNSQHNVPRVFAREIFGLSAFGYQPILTHTELSFKRVNEGTANGASLARYSKQLLDSKMIPRGDQTAVIAKLEDFLYREGKG